MTNEYSDCYYCGGSVREKLIPRKLRWKGELFIFEDVPMGVCLQCGECEERCPQHINIMDELKNVHARLAR